MEISLINENEIEEVSQMIERSIKLSEFANYYPECSVEYLIENHSCQNLKNKIKNSHFYVLKEHSKIIGCGAITPILYNKLSRIVSVFIEPSFQRKGFGRQIINTLEYDTYFTHFEKTEVRANVSAVPFYKKLGFDFKDKVLVYEDGCFIMEKPNKEFKK